MPISESAGRFQRRRKGYALTKSRALNEDYPAFGCFMIVDPLTNFAVAGVGPFGPDLDLDGAAEWANDLERNWRLN